jgi:glycosyltransferase involved in cell wall biosynthesis
MSAAIVRVMFRARSQQYTHIFTVECDWTTFIVAGIQTLLLQRRPRHVVLQFIMRERMASLASRAKYVFLRWCFSSVALCVCSSRSECEYYARAFRWPRTKLAFVPFHTDPSFLDVPTADGSTTAHAVSAGRTFRDYETLIDAFEGVDYPLTIVGYRPPEMGRTLPPHVTVHRELPLPDLTRLIAESSIVILPLQDREISTGQSVLLQAMAMGKAVVVTRASGTEDYIEHMRTGVFVPPRDAAALRDAVRLLAGDSRLRRRLGAAAREQVRRVHLLTHYLQGVSQVLEQRS